MGICNKVFLYGESIIEIGGVEGREKKLEDSNLSVDLKTKIKGNLR